MLDQLELVPDLQPDNISAIREVILYRINRNRTATLNSDLTVDYALKIPVNGVSLSSAHDLDIEWIISASSSTSAAASNQSSARTQRNSDSKETKEFFRNMNLNDGGGNLVISSGALRRPSGLKRLPWDELSDPPRLVHGSSAGSSHSAPKTATRTREVAPLKAFPLTDGLDFQNGN